MIARGAGGPHSSDYAAFIGATGLLVGCCTLEPRITPAPTTWHCPARAVGLLARIEEAGLVLRCEEPAPSGSR